MIADVMPAHGGSLQPRKAQELAPVSYAKVSELVDVFRKFTGVQGEVHSDESQTEFQDSQGHAGGTEGDFDSDRAWS